MIKFLTRFLTSLKSKFMGMQVTAVQQPIPAMPYDDNFKDVCVPMVAIVDANGEITSYLPLAAEDNGDGTASIKVTY